MFCPSKLDINNVLCIARISYQLNCPIFLITDITMTTLSSLMIFHYMVILALVL